MKCKIYRDFDTDKVTKVLDENGNESSLYREALAATKNEEEALNIWATTQLPSFKSYQKDNPLVTGSEPSVEQVLKFINARSTSGGLTTSDIADLMNNLQTLQIDSPDTLLSRLERVFLDKNGLFVVDRSKLKQSNLYTVLEINSLLSYPSVRANTREFINKLRYSISKEQNFPEIISDSQNQDWNVVNKSQPVGIGKFESYAPSEVRDYLIKNLREFTSEADFMSNLQSLDNEDIKSFVLDNPEVYDEVKTMVKSARIVPILTSFNDSLIPSIQGDKLMATIASKKVGNSTERFTDLISSLEDLTSPLWTNRDSLRNKLVEIETEAALNQLDIVGLRDSPNSKSKQEIVEFLQEVDSFLYSSETDSTDLGSIYSINNIINDFFGTEGSVSEKVIPFVDDEQGRNLVSVSNPASESNMFAQGLVKFKEDLYQKVMPFNSFNDLVENVYSNLLQDVTILPNSFLEDIGLVSEGKYLFSKLNNPKQSQVIKDAISKKISVELDPIRPVVSSLEYDNLKQASLYKHVLKIKEEVPSTISLEDFSNKRAQTHSDLASLDYISSDFVSDFYTEQLIEKINNTPTFNLAMQYFNVEPNGISFTSNDVDIQNQALLMLKETPIFSNLQGYAAMSKNKNLEFLLDSVQSPRLEDIQVRRDYVLNNPEVVPRFSQRYVRATPNTILIKGNTSEFIRVSDGMYEMTNSQNNLSVYSKLEAVEDANFYVMNQPGPKVEDIDLTPYESTETNLNFKNTSKVSNKEVQEKLLEKTC